MSHYEYKPVGSLSTFKSELIDFLQMLCVLALVVGVGWALINIQHPVDYYSSEAAQ